jgi:two-component system cell cycle response regulator DivK
MKSVLIVEDEPVGALLLKLVLTEHFICEMTNNSVDCKKMCHEKHFDFVILDINLGNDSLDGMELLNQLKELPNCKGTSFFAITAYAMPGDKNRFIKMGFDFYFSKPIVFKDLIESLHLIGKDNSIGSDTRAD